MWYACICLRYVRREKEIAESSHKLAESECLRHKQLLESTQRQLSSVQAELKELCDTATRRTQTAAEHQEILKKVHRLASHWSIAGAFFFCQVHHMFGGVHYLEYWCII